MSEEQKGSKPKEPKEKAPNKGLMLKLPKFMQQISAEQRAIIDSHLITDAPVEPLLKMIQETWGLCKDFSKGSLQRAIYRYKDKFILPKQAQVAAKVSSPELAMKVAALQTQLEQVLNPVQALEQVIAHQLERVNKLKATEEKMPTLMDSQTKNITALGDMLFKLAALHMDIGLLRKVPHKTEVIMTPEQQQFYSGLKTAKQIEEAKVEVLQFLHSQGVAVPDSSLQSIAAEGGDDIDG
jgi:hypothetical protein